MASRQVRPEGTCERVAGSGQPGGRQADGCPWSEPVRGLSRFDLSPRETTVRRLLPLLLALLLLPVVATASQGAPPERFPSRIDLPAGFQPEGIEAGKGTTVYVGSNTSTCVTWTGSPCRVNRSTCSPAATASLGRVVL